MRAFLLLSLVIAFVLAKDAKVTSKVGDFFIFAAAWMHPNFIGGFLSRTLRLQSAPQEIVTLRHCAS